MSAEAKLAALGIELPTPTPPLASYVPALIHGGLVYVSGQVPWRDGKLAVTGRVGAEVTQEQAADEARVCAIHVMAQLRAAAGSLEDIERIVKLTVFVSSAPDFTNQPAVANGASDLLVEVFGDAGRHARSAVGVAALPLNACVEIEAIAALRS